MAYTLNAIEKAVGYPLDPSDWENMYLEIGKTRDDCACPDVDAELDDPDDFDAEEDHPYRLFNWYSSDRFIPIDPATAIDTVKLVRDGITYKTFEADEFRVQWVNGNPKYTKYLRLTEHCWNSLPECWRDMDVQVAVQATWMDLQAELADLSTLMTAWDENDKQNIQSESLGSHSYSKFSDGNPATVHATTLQKWAGPNGSAKRRRIA